MASKKDMRRRDLIVPFTASEVKKSENDMQSTMASTLPMAAIFTRNKMIGWTAVIFAVQGWLGETAEQKKSSSTPAFLSVGMGVLSLGVAYLPLFLPPQFGPAGAGSGTTPPAAVPAQ